MKIVVIGGTGLIGSQVVQKLTLASHDAVRAARSTGVDVIAGHGLERVLEGAEVVINLANSPTFDETSVDFFRTFMSNVLEAGARAGVRHQVVLSIVGVDRVPQLDYFRTKAVQEELLRQGPTPYSIVRATQFFEFMDTALSWASDESAVRLPATRIQPVASADPVREVHQARHSRAGGQGSRLRLRRRRHRLRGPGDRVRALYELRTNVPGGRPYHRARSGGRTVHVDLRGQGVHPRNGGPRHPDTIVGPLINGRAAARVAGLVTDAVDKGARILYGGEAPTGAFHPATVLDRITGDMRIYAEEVFGPVATILTASDDDEAITLANDTEFGLSSAVYTENLGRGLAVARQFRHGAAHINDHSVADEAEAPVGGVKNSGFGHFNSQWGVEFFTETRWVTLASRHSTVPLV
jgi:uncharacterized protein YbjT (DUF2867 family)